MAGLAAELLGAPYAFVTIVDDERSFWKACIGTDGEARQNVVGDSFCQSVIGLDRPLLIADARLDPRTSANPSIKSKGVIAWAGHPVRDSSGEVLGSFCVVDTRVRHWDATHSQILEVLAGAAASEIALRSAAITAEASRAAAQRLAERSTLLGSLARSLSSSGRTDEVCELIVELVPQLLDAEVSCSASRLTRSMKPARCSASHRQRLSCSRDW